MKNLIHLAILILEKKFALRANLSLRMGRGTVGFQGTIHPVTVIWGVKEQFEFGLNLSLMISKTICNECNVIKILAIFQVQY